MVAVYRSPCQRVQAGIFRGHGSSLLDVFLWAHHLQLQISKASEASWSYSCDSKVSFDRVQILTPDFSGRRPPPPPPLLPSPHLPSSHLPSPHLPSPHLPSPPPCLPPIFPPSFLPLRKFDSVLSSLFGMRLALRILQPHSLTLTLTLSLSHCLSHLSHLFLISLISLSSLSLSPLCLSSFRLSSLSSLAGGSGQRATYKGLFTPASKKSAVFFPTSLPSTFPFWSASFRPPLGLK